MLNAKPWYMSKTIWGSLVSILAAFLGLWDFDLSASEQARVVELIVQLIGASGAMLALIGRFLATRRLE